MYGRPGCHADPRPRLMGASARSASNVVLDRGDVGDSSGVLFLAAIRPLQQADGDDLIFFARDLLYLLVNCRADRQRAGSETTLPEAADAAWNHRILRLSFAFTHDRILGPPAQAAVFRWRRCSLRRRFAWNRAHSRDCSVVLEGL